MTDFGSTQCFWAPISFSESFSKRDNIQDLSQMAFGVLPSIEGDETVYSWASRTHVLLGRSATLFSKRLFGSVRAARTPDAPMNLAHLFEVTGGQLGLPQDILAKHTSLGGFFPYLTEARRQAVTDALVSGCGAQGSLHLGVRASGLPGTFHLRFCRSCIEHDIASIGLPSWKTAHQLPAVWICPRHLTTLVELQRCSTVWQLPNVEHMATGRPVPDDNDGVLKLAAKISITAFELGHVNLVSVRQAALEKLCSIGLVTNPARLPVNSLHSAFCASPIGRAIQSYLPLRPLLERETWLADLVRDRVGPHPIKWAVAWAWMWQEASLTAALGAFSIAARGGGTTAATVQLEIPFDEADRAHRICVERIVEAMPFVSSMSEIATYVGASNADVSRWFRSYPILRMKWSDQIQKIRRSTAVHRIETYLQQERPTSDKELLNACRAELMWLSRHEETTATRLRSSVPKDRPRQLVLFKRDESSH